MCGNQSRSDSEPLKTIDDLSVGDVLYNVDKEHFLEVVAIDYEYVDGVPDGTVTLRQGPPDSAPGDDEPVEWDAEDLDYRIHGGWLRDVPRRVLERPEAVISDFVSEKLSDFLLYHSQDHDYNGIDGVRIVGDIVVAQELADRRRQERGAQTESEGHES